jgi:hypothetical protein
MYIAIPDLHGQISIWKKLEPLLKRMLKKNKKIKIIFLGDYVCRGETKKINGRKFKDAGSLLLLKELIKFKAFAETEGYFVKFLLGNHEKSLLNLIRRKYYKEKIFGKFTKEYKLIKEVDKSFEGKRRLIGKVKDFLESLDLYVYDERKELFFVHAGISKEGDIRRQTEETYISIRKEFLDEEEVSYPIRIIFGHTRFKKIHITKDKLGLDSGIHESRELRVGFIKNNNNFKIYTLTKKGKLNLKVKKSGTKLL